MASTLRLGACAALSWAALFGCSGADEEGPTSATSANRPGGAPSAAREASRLGGASRTPGSGQGVGGDESCSGCARFDVPLSSSDQFGMFELTLPTAVDMTNTTITWRLRAIGFSGTSGGVSPYVRDADEHDQCFIWTELDEISTWTDVACEFSERYPGGAKDEPFNNDFDRRRVEKLGLQIHSGEASPDAVYADALVYLDAIMFSNGVSPDLTFDVDISDFEFLPGDSTAPAGTTVTYLGD